MANDHGNSCRQRRESSDEAVAAAVRTQHGVISRAQLRSLGMATHEIDYRVKVGRLHPLHRGVYAVGHRAPSRHAEPMAAVLACGTAALLGAESASALWGMLRPVPGSAMVVLTPRYVRPRPGIDVRTAAVTADERTRHFGIPVTTPARTLLDLALVVDERTLSRAIRQAEVQGLVKHAALVKLAASGRRGAPALRAVLAPVATATRSSLEDDVVDALRGVPGTPRFLTNARVSGREVDLYFPELDLVVELDSERYHGTPQAQYEDALKQAALEAAGHRVLRVPIVDPQR